MIDSRIKIKKRQIILTILDPVNISFTNKDQEWMAEVIEDKLRQNFDITIDLIEIQDIKK